MPTDESSEPKLLKVGEAIARVLNQQRYRCELLQRASPRRSGRCRLGGGRQSRVPR